MPNERCELLKMKVIGNLLGIMTGQTVSSRTWQLQVTVVKVKCPVFEVYSSFVGRTQTKRLRVGVLNFVRGVFRKF
jgi:hypothetical protein